MPKLVTPANILFPDMTLSTFLGTGTDIPNVEYVVGFCATIFKTANDNTPFCLKLNPKKFYQSVGRKNGHRYELYNTPPDEY